MSDLLTHADEKVDKNGPNDIEWLMDVDVLPVQNNGDFTNNESVLY